MKLVTVIQLIAFSLLAGCFESDIKVVEENNPELIALFGDGGTVIFDDAKIQLKRKPGERIAYSSEEYDDIVFIDWISQSSDADSIVLGQGKRKFRDEYSYWFMKNIQANNPTASAHKKKLVRMYFSANGAALTLKGMELRGKVKKGALPLDFRSLFFADQFCGETISSGTFDQVCFTRVEGLLRTEKNDVVKFFPGDTHSKISYNADLHLAKVDTAFSRATALAQQADEEARLFRGSAENSGPELDSIYGIKFVRTHFLPLLSDLSSEQLNGAGRAYADGIEVKKDTKKAVYYLLAAKEKFYQKNKLILPDVQWYKLWGMKSSRFQEIGRLAFELAKKYREKGTDAQAYHAFILNQDIAWKADIQLAAFALANQFSEGVGIPNWISRKSTNQRGAQRMYEYAADCERRLLGRFAAYDPELCEEARKLFLISGGRVKKKSKLKYTSKLNFFFTHACQTAANPSLRTANEVIEMQLFEMINGSRTSEKWPDKAGEVYLLEGHSLFKNTKSISIRCAPSTNVCYGAAIRGGESSLHWGLGDAGEKSCTDCCTRCPLTGWQDFRVELGC